MNKMSEIEQIRQRYERRAHSQADDRYDPLQTSVCMGNQEKERALIRWIRTCGLAPVADKHLLEIGCGSGSNLLEFLRLGFQPENLVGIELLEDRAVIARHRLPNATKIRCGDASDLSVEIGLFDVVLQSTVFTSLLDDAFQHKLADRMWTLTKPGGGVLWYDFIYNNPRNPDVRGVPIRRIRALFPHGKIKVWRLTLAPPISRRVTRIHPSLYSLLNALPFLRTHVLCWIRKPL
jgi:SAM-dependent methyltransferase